MSRRDKQLLEAVAMVVWKLLRWHLRHETTLSGPAKDQLYEEAKQIKDLLESE